MKTKIISINNQRMTSLEIAELTGKQHKHVMDAVRKMEAAWVKVCGSKFRLTSRTVIKPNISFHYFLLIFFDYSVGCGSEQ